jgi:vancomycin permeability regulator SanA
MRWCGLERRNLVAWGMMKRVRTRRRRLLFWAVVLLAIPLVLPAALVIDGLTDDLGWSDVAIVPGNTVYPDGTPSPRLAARLDRARELYAQHQVKAVIVSGGKGIEGYDEAKAMKTWLVSRGLPAAAVIQDSAGVTTMATASNSKALMETHGFETATVVTQYFHVPRTRLALRKAGVVADHTAHARFFEMRDLYSIPREVVGYAAYLIRYAASSSRVAAVTSS